MFCKYCGKQIPEGEVCLCEDAVNQRAAEQDVAVAPAEQDVAVAPAEQGTTGQVTPEAAPPAASINVDKIVQSAVDAIRSVPAALKQVAYAPASRLATAPAIVVAIGCMLLHMFAGMCFYGNLTDVLLELVYKISAGAISVPEVYDFSLTGIGAWCGILTYALTTLGAFVMGVIYCLINKEDGAALASFQRAASVGAYPAAAFFVSGLFFLISPVLGLLALLITIFTGAASLVFLQNVLRNKATTAVTLLVCGVVIAVITVVVGWVNISVLVNYVAEYLRQQVNNSIGGLGGMFG